MNSCRTLHASGSGLLAIAIATTITACTTSPQAVATSDTRPLTVTDSAGRCEGLSRIPIANGRVEGVDAVPAGGTLAGGGTPGAQVSANLCRVRLRLVGAPGSDIHAEIWLPEVWNRKLMGFGGAGFDGGLNPGVAPMLNKVVAEGYAAVANDAGHPPGASIESWTHQQPDKVVDFGHRANHLAAVAAKQVIEAFYGNAPTLSYFTGCSNGGRDGIMLASRYPGDYDAIVAGAPAMRYTEIVTQLGWYSAAVLGPGGAPELQSKLGLVHAAVNRQCDALDGVEDGILENPLLCEFDPAVLQCKGDDTTDCLTQAEVGALHKIYGGTRLSNGTQVIAGPVVGSEGAPDWGAWITTPMGTVISQEFYRWFVYGDPKWDISQFDLDRDYALARERVAPIINADDPDLDAFIRRGGKLLMYQGWYDVAILPTDTIDYYEAVHRRVGDEAARNLRLFMVPGMGHCTGGPGASSFDMQAALERWVERGEAPERIVAAKPDSGEPPLTRALCPWPRTARYTGRGSTRDAENFECREP